MTTIPELPIDNQEIRKHLYAAGIEMIDDLVDTYISHPHALGKNPDKAFLRRLKQIKRKYLHPMEV